MIMIFLDSFKGSKVKYLAMPDTGGGVYSPVPKEGEYVPLMSFASFL